MTQWQQETKCDAPLKKSNSKIQLPFVMVTFKLKVLPQNTTACFFLELSRGGLTVYSCIFDTLVSHKQKFKKIQNACQTIAYNQVVLGTWNTAVSQDVLSFKT